MSIRRAAYDLCKSVWASPIRAQLQNTIHSLNSATDEQMRTGNHRASFGFAARRLHAQVLGYLVVDKNKEKIAENYPPLRWMDGLSVDESRLLSAAHKQFVALDTRCTSRLIEVVPNCKLAVDPYFKFGYQVPNDIEDISMFDEQLADAFVNALQQHPAIRIASDTNRERMPTASGQTKAEPPDITQAVLRLETSLLNAGPLRVHNQLFQLLATSQSGTPNSNFLDHICALTCLKATLDTINELIFQALLTPQLPTLDDNNIIDVDHFVRTSASTGFTVKFQATAKTGLGELGLILMKGKILDQELDLCRIESIEVSISSDYGDTVSAVVREIDENLNPYPGLLRQQS
jgi:hypothetical protein